MTTTDISPWSPPTDHAPDIFKDSTAWIVLPAEPAEPVSPLPRLIRETREMTGWAQRDLANVLRTSHTTVRRLETDGRVTTRSRAIATRAAELHAVLVRLARIAGGSEALVVALGQTVRGTTALDLLREGEWSKAYTAALDAVRGPRPAMLGAANVPIKPATREIRP